MSLYRNWRPRTFADLVGQEAVVRTLSQALTSGRLVHAYLFSGPRGSGKTSAAKIMARCITCETGPSATPDNSCENCRAILDGTALDVMEIDAASNRGIDEIRALRDAVKFAPSTMRKKVYIVDEAHMLTKEGANAFLKTLEEPPPHVVFILATTAPEALPVTIISRCQRFAFRRIATPVMVERMRHIARAEGIAIDDSALGAIAYRADGGLRDALTMLEQAASFTQGTIDLATIEVAFGSSGRVFAGAILDAFIASDAVGILRAIEAASDAGTDMSNLIRSLIAELRHVVVGRVDLHLLAGELVAEDTAKVKDRLAQLSQARALRALRLLSEALMQSRTSGNPRLELEAAMLRLALQGEDPSLEALASRVRQLEDQLAQGVGVPTQHPGLQPATGPVVAAQPPSRPKVATKGASLGSPSAAVEVTALAPEAAGQSDQVALPEVEPECAALPEVPVQPEPPVVPVVAVRSKPVAPKAAASVPAEGAAGITDPALAMAVQTAASLSAEPLTLQRVKSLWPNVVARAEGNLPSLRGPLSRAVVASVEGSSITLQLADEQNAHILRSRLVILEAAVSGVLGGECRVLVTLGSGTQPRSAKKRQAESADTTLGLLDYAAKRLGT